MNRSHINIEAGTTLNWILGLFIVGLLATLSGFWLAFVPPGRVAQSAGGFAFLLAALIHMINGVIAKIPSADDEDSEASAQLAIWFRVSTTLMVVCFLGYFLTKIQL